MAEEFDVSCPNCSMVFSVPRELCGEMAECSECATVFEIPFPEEVRPLESTETGAIQGVAAEPEAVDATNTVKLSRTGIGMIPTLKESFEFGTKASAIGGQQAVPQMKGSNFSLPPAGARPVPPPRSPAAPAPMQAPVPAPQQAPPPQQAAPQNSKTGMSFKKPTFTKPGASTASAPVPTAPPPAPPPSIQAGQTQQAQAPTSMPAIQIPAWAKIVLHKNEDVYAYNEVKYNPIVSLILIVLPVLLCIPLPIIPSPWSFVAALVIAVATFAVAFVMLAKSSKTAVVLTSQRAISVCGIKRAEAKK